MSRYLVHRLALSVLVVWVVLSFVFLALRILPGDYAAAQVGLRYFGGAAGGESIDVALQEARAEIGLDKPVVIQYGKFLRDMVRGDLGRSFQTKRPITTEVKRAFPYSLQFGIISSGIAILISLPLGIVSALYHGRSVDDGFRLISVVGLAAPPFWTATIATIAVIRWELFEIDVVGRPGIWEDPLASLQLFLVPTLAAGFASASVLTRVLRSQMLDVLEEDYVRTARAKGLTGCTVLIRHALRNALLPYITILGIVFGAVVGNGVILETMFNIPGMGRALVNGITSRDLPLVQGMTLVIVIMVLVLNLIIDLVYMRLDPRVTIGSWDD